ncbi:hypothetical protein H9X96_02965 [Pedobacter sp. N36a]|uniref:hypothetical protein n=1 Tax=Pedobacter sp. N36a TaxID=2767996 RepID=UPI001656B074|nr:hypothetical protein [Pedobacter sp. N36a]MBC8984732.1 hypothetical protein [Pedobacter sp. N36a]
MNRKIVFSVGVLLRPIYLWALCCILLSYSCSKNQGLPDPAKKKEKPKDPEKPVPPGNSVLIPTTIKSQNLLMTFKYEAESNLLTELIQSDGWVTKFFYRKDGTPMEQEYHKDNKLQQKISYVHSKEGMVEKILLFDKSGTTSTGSYFLVQDEKKRTTQLKKLDPRGKLVEEENISYNPQGNIISVLVTNNGNTTAMTSTYDNRPGIYRNIPYFQLLFLIQPQVQSRAIYSNNNPLRLDYLPLSITSSSFTYEYNSNNYPSNLDIKKEKHTETLKITYKKIKPK